MENEISHSHTTKTFPTVFRSARLGLSNSWHFFSTSLYLVVGLESKLNTICVSSHLSFCFFALSHCTCFFASRSRRRVRHFSQLITKPNTPNTFRIIAAFTFSRKYPLSPPPSANFTLPKKYCNTRRRQSRYLYVSISFAIRSTPTSLIT